MLVTLMTKEFHFYAMTSTRETLLMRCTCCYSLSSLYIYNLGDGMLIGLVTSFILDSIPTWRLTPQ